MITEEECERLENQAKRGRKPKPRLARVANEQRFFIPGTLPGLNELIDARMKQAKTRSKKGKLWNAYSKLKRDSEERIKWAIKAAKIAPCEHLPVYLVYSFIEEHKRRDKSNIAAGGIKLIEDSLVTSGILPGDGWKHIEGWHCTFEVNKSRAGVRVSIWPNERR